MDKTESFNQLKYRNPDLKFTISSRQIDPCLSISDYIKLYYMYIDIEQVSSLFGFVNYFTPFYGGRSYNVERSLNESQLREMKELGISVSLNLTNHFFDSGKYDKSRAILDKFHKKGNLITCFNDELALRLKSDFPEYTLIASMIKNIDTADKIKRAEEIYDKIVLPMNMNDNERFLESIDNKEKIILFGNAGCAYNCPARTCYKGISQNNFNLKRESFCSKSKIERERLPYKYFDLEKLSSMGFKEFKLIPEKNKQLKNIKTKFVNQKSVAASDFYSDRAKTLISSFPKSGRTWLRYLLAFYINRKSDLNMEPDLINVFSLIPNANNRGIKGLSSTIAFHNSCADIPLIMCAHSKEKNKEFKGNKRVFMYRKLFDLIVSNYFQDTFFLEKNSFDIKAYLRKDKSVIKKYAAYLKSVIPFLDSSFVLSFEQMKADTYTVVRDLFEYLGFDRDDEFLRESTEAASFNNMKKLEDKFGILTDKKITDIRGRRVRNGKVGSYREILDDEDILFIEETFKDTLGKQNLRILESRGIKLF